MFFEPRLFRAPVPWVEPLGERIVSVSWAWMILNCRPRTTIWLVHMLGWVIWMMYVAMVAVEKRIVLLTIASYLSLSLSLLQSIANLAKAFENGFDNYSTVRGDPDLDPIKQQGDFIKLMDSYESKGFNPFGFFANK
jgi:hypothetical protein